MFRRILSALLLQLHAKEHIVLSGNEKDGYFIEKRRHPGRDRELLSVEEKEALDRIPEKRFKLDGKGGKSIYKAEQACEKSLDNRFGRMFSSGMGAQFLAFALSWYLAVFLWRWHLPDPPDLDGDEAMLLYAGPLAFAFFAACLAPSGTRALRKLSAWIPFLAVPVLLLLPGWLGSEENTLESVIRALSILHPASPLQWILFLGVLAAPFCFAPLMPRPNEDLARLASGAEGFAMYLHAAEAGRFSLANQPRHDPALYSRYLPYAVALGEEKAWGRRFAALLATVSAAEASAGTESVFIARPEMLGGFTRSVQTCRSAGAPKSSSSSSGGSSFSGGGAGSGGCGSLGGC